MDNLDLNKALGGDDKLTKLKRTVTKPWFILLAAGLLSLIVLIFSVNSVMIALLHSRTEVVVPDLEGQGLLDALSVVSEFKLALAQDGEEFDESLPAGTILRQHPSAGMKVRAGRIVRIVVSKGGQVVFVPNILSKPLAEAQSLLSQDRIQMGSVRTSYSVDVPDGLVISQAPSSGTVVTRGALVDVEVSKGLPPIGAPLIPDFEGQGVAQVRTWASGVNIKVSVSEESDAKGIPGTVLSQQPFPGQPVLEGESIMVTVVPGRIDPGSTEFHFEVPNEFDEAVVRIMVRDSSGEREVYEDKHSGGESIDVPIKVTSTTRVRVYINGGLHAEQVLEP